MIQNAQEFYMQIQTSDGHKITEEGIKEALKLLNPSWKVTVWKENRPTASGND